MENGEKIPWNFLNWPSLVVFVLLSWGIVLLPPALVSKRPSGEPERPKGPAQEHRYESRLWQDPFDVLAAVLREQTQSSYKPPFPKTALRTAAGNKGNTLILAVFLRGESYSEEVESRLRSRYAVVSALSTAGYTADEAGDLRCLSVPEVTWPVFPFERFTHRGLDTDKDHYQEHLDTLVSPVFRQVKPPGNVAVVWVDESLLDATNVGSHPLEALKRFCKQLTKDVPDASLAVIGPQSSDTLSALLSDVGCVTDEQRGDSDAGLTRIYSCASTVGALREHRPRSPLLEKHFELVHVIGTDRELATALLAELERRGVSPAKEPARIALVAEWDTYYGRNMVERFSEVFRAGRCFTYQRGIDGRLPNAPAGESKEGDKSGGQAKSVLPGGEPLVVSPQVQAFGRSQVDYLPRLVDQMKAENGIAQPWKAIGVLGSDLYDKVMLIEVFRHAFPEALIFTTDLDARYLDTENFHVTRNLLVGSHYGLELNKDLQWAIPPFRSVYQTSLYFGCLKAIYDQSELRPGAKARAASPLAIRWKSENDPSNPRPLVFEIGQSRALPLTDPGTKGLHPDAYRRTLPLEGVQWLYLAILVLAGMTLGGILLSVLTSRLHQFAAGATLILLAIVFIAIVILAAFNHKSSDGEPFSIFEGVSNWPTILLRVTAAAYCVYALIRAHQSDQESEKKLKKDYLEKDQLPGEQAQPQGGKAQPQGAQAQPECENPPSAKVKKLRAAWTWAYAKVKKLRAAWTWACANPPSSLTDNGDKVEPAGLWERYREFSLSRFIRRVLIWCVPFVCFCLASTGLFGWPNNPYRGSLNFYVDRLVLWAAIILTVVLIWTVFDATRLCNWLIRELVDKETNWPKPVLERAATELGVNPQLLRSIDNSDCEPVKRSLEQYADLTFLSERTAVVGHRVYDAAIACLLLFLARSPVFDQYVMSWSMILIFAVAVAVVLTCGAHLRYSAREARRKGHEKVREALYSMRRVPGGGPIGTALERIDRGLDQVRTGAFSKLIDDPFLHMLFLIVGGSGALLSLEPIRMLLQHGG